MDDEDIEIVYSNLSREIEIDGYFFDIAIYRSADEAGWILEVENEFGTSTVWDNPFIADGMAIRAFEKTVEEDGIIAFFTDEERRRIAN